MNPDHERLKEILAEAAGRPTPAERAAYLDAACLGDAALRAHVEGLLQAHDQATGFLEQTNVIAGERLIWEGPGSIIGRYKLLQEIGEGGFGIVFMAEQVEPVQRKVAIKIIKAGMDTREVIARFEAERQALALMDHPNIARVLDAGTTESGRPYFVMELVKGIPITAYCDQNSLSTEERLRLFIKVCHAVQHAHQKGIIHRDLKPTNLQVTVIDGQAVPKVIDFGVAKALGRKLTEKTLFTRFEEFIGTPAYMSPEQAELSGVDVDTRSDIYSLGVLLYELLTSKTPFDQETLQKAPLHEIRRLIRETEPLRPSTRLTELARSRKPEVGGPWSVVSSQVRGDLDWIVMKCLEKDRTRRYETASSLLEDVERFLRHEQVRARPPTTCYRCQKFYQRHRGPVLAGATVLLSLLLGLAVSVSGFVQASRQRNRAIAAERVAQAAQQAEVSRRQKAEAERRQAIERQEAAERGDRLSRRRLYAAQLGLASRALKQGDLLAARDLLAAQLPVSGSADVRSFEWYHLWSLCHEHSRALVMAPDSGMHAAFFPETQLLATAGAYALNPLGVWDVATGRARRTFGDESSLVWSLAVSPDRQSLATGGARKSGGEVILWDTATGQPRLKFPGHPIGVLGLAFSPDGQLLAAAGGHFDQKNVPGAIKVWRTATGEEVTTLAGHAGGVRALGFSPDGRTLASGSFEGTIRLWETATWRCARSWRTHQPDLEPVLSLAWSPDGRLLAAGGKPFVRIYEAGTGELRHFWESAETSPVQQPWSPSADQTARPRGDRCGVFALAFSPDGRTLASAGQSSSIALWDVAAGREAKRLQGLAGWVNTLSFSSDGSRLVSGEAEEVKVWDLSATGKTTLCTHHDQRGQPAAVLRKLLAFSARARTLAIAGERMVELRDVESESLISSVPAARVAGLALSPDGARLATVSQEGATCLWNAGTGDAVRSIASPDLTNIVAPSLSFSPDGQWLALGRRQGVLLLDALSGVVRTNLALPEDQVVALAFSPNSGILAAACLGPENRDGAVRTWDARSGAPEMPLDWDARLLAPLCLDFSPDGTRLAVGGGNLIAPDQAASVLVFDPATGRQVCWLEGHLRAITGLAFAPDGQTLLTADYGGTIRTWDTCTWEERFSSELQEERPGFLAFAPSGRLLAMNTAEGRVHLWRAAPNEQLDRWAVEALLRKWHRLRSQGRPAGAIGICDLMTRLEPANPESWCARGQVSLAQGEWSRAVSDFARAVELEAGNHSYWSWRADALGRLGEWEKMKADCSQALTLNPRACSALARRAQACAEIGQWEEATADARRLVEQFPADLTNHSQLACLCLARGDLAGYRERVNLLVERTRQAPTAAGASLVGWTCALAPGALTDYGPILQLAQAVAAGTPGEWRSLLAPGALSYRAGAPRAALESLQAAERLLSRSDGNDRAFPRACARYFLALAYQQMRHAAQAASALEKANAAAQAALAERPPGGALRWDERLTLRLLRQEAESLTRPQ